MTQQEQKQNKFRAVWRTVSRSLAIVPLFFIWVGIANGAELKLNSQAQEIGVGQQFEASLSLDTQNEDINALEGKIIFPAGLLELKEIRDGNSIINFWIERPSVSRQTDAKQERETDAIIVFSGITPGGFNGKNGLIFSAIFETKSEGVARFEVGDARVLRNDGTGSAATLVVAPLEMTISKKVSAEIPVIPELKDTEPPESFTPEVARDPTVFDGKWFLVFATQDKISGIAGYAVCETKRKLERETDAKWIEAESPYLLRDQRLRSYIYVKAVDRAGNERIVMLSPRMAWYQNYLILGILIMIGLIIAAISSRKNLWKKK